MRRVVRIPLPALTQQALDGKQDDFDLRRAQIELDAGVTWDAARKTIPILTCLGVLREMAGHRERCMYCSDSHGADIEHFWPKAVYPEHLFRWWNLLLCCTECGRFKGKRFPLDDGVPMLLDPTGEDPWTHLDFDPTTGNVVASFNAIIGAWSTRGTATVEVLKLDRREALAAAYLKSYRRLVSVVVRALRQEIPNAAALCGDLREADDHGLLGWCFRGTGQKLQPFSTLKESFPDVWAICAQQVG
jgi:uncharacterized protein (TIGR02646 family)